MDITKSTFLFLLFCAIVIIVSVSQAFAYQEINPPNIVLEFQEADVIMFSSTSTVDTSSYTNVVIDIFPSQPIINLTRQESEPQLYEPESNDEYYMFYNVWITCPTFQEMNK